MLKLGSNPLGDAGVEALLAFELLQLEALHLESTQLGNASAVALVRSARLPRLERLDLSSNNISDAGAQAIAQSPARLHSLNLRSNVIGARGDKALRARYGARVHI